MRLLLDMDGVITDIEKQLKIYAIEHFDKFITEEDLEKVNFSSYHEIISVPSFFETMDPIEGSLETIKFLDQFYDLTIVTAPGGNNLPQCVKEKQIWIEKYLPFLKQRVIMTKQKYLVQGDYLIDDMEHNLNSYPGKTICFRQPWNKNRTLLKEPDFYVSNWEELSRYLLP